MPALLKEDVAAIGEMLRGMDGPVQRMLFERSERFKVAVRRMQPRKSGCLQDSTVRRFIKIDGELAVRFVSDTSGCKSNKTHMSYSLYVHEGTKPHIIRAKNAPMLAFFWPNGPQGAKMYFFKSVNHPGTKPIPFFKDNLHLMTEGI